MVLGGKIHSGFSEVSQLLMQYSSTQLAELSRAHTTPPTLTFDL